MIDKYNCIHLKCIGTSLAVQWLKLWASSAGVTGLIPGQGANNPHAMQHDQKTSQINSLKEKSSLNKYKNTMYNMILHIDIVEWLSL